MAIISKPVEILKGQDNIFTLNKSELVTEAKVIADSYFSDQANWNKVILAYLTDTGKQVEFVTFDATQTTPTGNFRVSSKARNLFQIDALILQDFDGGYLRFERDELTVGDFDVDFNAAPPVLTGYFSNEFTSIASYESYSDGNFGSVIGPGTLSGTLFISDDVSGNMSYTFKAYDYVEADTSKPLIFVDDLATGIDVNFDVTLFNDGGAGTLLATLTVNDGLFGTGGASSSGVFISGTGPYTLSISKALMLSNSVTSILDMVLDISGGTGSSQIGIDNLEIVANQTTRTVLEQNIVAGAVRDLGADLALNGSTATQTFSHNANFQVDQALMFLEVEAKSGSGSRIADMQATILDTNGITQLGTSDILTIDVVPGNTGPAWQVFTFPTPVTGLISGNTYTLQLESVNGFSGPGTSASRALITYNTSSTYPNGEFRVSGGPIGDCIFRIIGSES